MGAIDERKWDESSDEVGRESSMVVPKANDHLIGRERELAMLDEALTAPRGRRLVTLVGPAGVGKTRLAAWFGARLSDAHADLPALFCDLAQATSADDLALGVGTVLGIMGDEISIAPAPTARRIAEHFASGVMLILVLDNLEQLSTEATDLLRNWIAVGQNVRFLATSRRASNIPGEQSISVAPLSEIHAVRLFIARAATRIHGGALHDDDSRRTIGNIVRTLDGLPLAIELAAARLDSFSLNDVAQQLERFDQAASASGALATAIAWSCSLLSPAHADALEALSIFNGPFELESAAVVLGGVDARETMAQLTRHCLAQQERSNGTFSLLPSVREAAATRLDATRAQTLRERLDQLILVRTRRTLREIETTGDSSLLRELERDRVELQDLANRAPATTSHAALTAMTDAAIAVAVCQSFRANPGASLATIRAALQAMLSVGGEASERVARLELTLARSLAQLGQLGDAEAAVARALATARACGAPRVECMALTFAARLRLGAEELQSALALASQASECAKAVADRRLLALALACRANAELGLDELVPAARDADDAIASFHTLGQRADEASGRLLRGAIAFAAGEVRAARAHVEAGLALAIEIDDRRLEASAHGQLARVAHAAGELEVARAEYSRALAIAGAGDRKRAALYRGAMALIDLQRCALPETATILDAAQRDLEASGSSFDAAAFAAAAAGARAITGEIELDQAERTLRALEMQLARSQRRHASLVPGVYLATVRALRGDVDSARARLSELLASNNVAVRLAVPLLARVLSDLDERARTWSISEDGTQIGSPGAEVICIAHRPLLARLTSILLRHRMAAPGDALDKTVLVRELWPGELDASLRTTENRLRVAVNTVRKCGLDALLVTRGSGYLLDPNVPVRILPPRA